MLTDDELAHIHTLLDDGATPIPIQQFLRYLLKCIDDLSHTQQRVQYLLTLAERMMDTPAGKLEALAYMPGTCPKVPQFTAVPEVGAIAPADQKVVYEAALEGGFQLLTPMEAQCLLQGISTGMSKDGEILKGVILLITIGQRIREQQIP
jgi:hypothetical protein